jgi:hypothetical protein
MHIAKLINKTLANYAEKKGKFASEICNHLFALECKMIFFKHVNKMEILHIITSWFWQARLLLFSAQIKFWGMCFFEGALRKRMM